MTGFGGCWAYAKDGDTVAAPMMTLMKSRRSNPNPRYQLEINITEGVARK